ncbi:hypothetical protein ACIBBE_06335 [Streptomyces sp. NPDC051644]|uniref:hypothetical protein n=1 Tax=Streptomyces sp. NPDC051644 TaxID=3365666 RepID=UPI0037939390
MARLQHTVTVVAVDRDRLHAYAGLVCDLAESTRARGRDIVLPDGRTVPGLSLVKGDHLRPGARYEPSGTGSDTEELEATVVREWRRGSLVAVEQLVRSPELSGRMTLRLRSPERPRSLEAEGRVRGPEGSGSLRRLSGKVSLDLAAWWAAAALAPGAPTALRAPATVRLKHRLGVARLQLGPRPAEQGRWYVDVTLTLHGRLLLRPVAAFALLLAGVPLRRGFRSSVEQAAERWNETLDRILAQDLDELRTEFADYVAKCPDDRAHGADGAREVG